MNRQRYLSLAVVLVILNTSILFTAYSEDADSGQHLAISQIKYWAYQIQGLNEPGAVDALADSSYDMLVLEPTRTDWSSDDRLFDTKGMVQRLKETKASDGIHRKLIIAYIDIGEAEDWRWYWDWSQEWPVDKPRPADWPDYIITHDPDGWVGNYPVAYWDERWKDIIIYGQNQDSDPHGDYNSVIDEVIRSGFDGIYLDWVEAFEDEAVMDAAQSQGKDPAVEMIDFIREMREYAIQRNPNFIIIQQNASALSDEGAEAFSVIDAIAQEAIWYDGDATDDWNDPNGYDYVNDADLANYYLGYLDEYKKAGIPVFDCEYALNFADDTYEKSYAKGYVPLCTRRSLSELTTTPPAGLPQGDIGDPDIDPTGFASNKMSLWAMDDGPHLRGANIYQRRVYPELDGPTYMGPNPLGPPHTQERFDELSALGANYVNISHPGLFTETPPYVLDQDIQDNLDMLLDMIAKADMFAVISFRTGPGRSEFTFFDGDWFDESYINDSVWQDQAAQDAWAAMWRYTAERYSNNPIVVGYDLMVEPNANARLEPEIWEPDEFYPSYANTLADWNQLHPRISDSIREVDLDTPILIGALSYSGVYWLPYLQSTGDPNTVYMVHQYEPQEQYTHQFADSLVNTYPGVFDTDWDEVDDQFNRSWLEDFLSLIDEFIQEHNVPVAVNEFGIMRWVPGAAEFMDDQIDIFEQKGMNHAVWDWEPIWPELAADNDEFNFLHGPDPNNHTDVSSSPLSDVILKYWARNAIRPSDVTAPDTPVAERILSITSAEASPGSSTTVYLSVTDAAGIAGADVEIAYDASVITVSEVNGTNLISDMNLMVNMNIPGAITIGMAGTAGISSGSGSLVSIELMVNASAQAGTQTTLQIADAEVYSESGATIPVDTQNGVVQITQGALKGDVNGDGKVRSNDAILTLRIATGLMTPTSDQQWAADMNGDGRVRSNDAILILRETAGLAAPVMVTGRHGEGEIRGLNALSRITVALDKAHGIAGERIAVPIRVDNTDILAGGDICIAYDSDVLRAVGVSSDPNMLLVSNASEPGMVRIAFASLRGLSDQTVAEIQFDVLADDVSPLRFQQAELYSPDALPLNSIGIGEEFRSWAIPPEHSALLQNFPNPFNPETWIPYQLRKSGNVTIKIFSASGELVRELKLGDKPAGFYADKSKAAYWDGKNKAGEEVASGIYFYTIQSGNLAAMKKMVVAR